MKWMIFLMFLIVGRQAAAQPQPVEIKRMQDYYFIGNDDELKSGVNCIVLKTRKQFDRMFGTTSRPDTPRFSKELMLVLLMPAGKREAKLEFKRISMKAGGFIEVYCDIDRKVRPLTYVSNPINTCVIPKYPGITKINFYDEYNMRLLGAVDIGERR